jgi:DNA-binding transcriptional regulator YhcF (GntR family)
VLLAPLQWAVWLILQEADASHRLISYRTIAKETEATMEGVRKAVRVLEKEKLVVRKDTVRTAEEQGFRVVVDATRSVQKGTLNEAKAILKRGLSIEQTTDRQGKVLGTDGLRLFVCNNINIKQTDVASLLRVPPPNWKIREQTLIQIADTHPDMTAIEFRLSLLYLIEQGKQAKEPIRNPNAWIKAAFEKNGGPLVTEREIEARFEQASPTHTPQPVKETGQGGTEEIELLRWYLACGPEERAEIDRSAEEKAAPLLAVIAEDKRAGVLEEARLEAIRERVAKLT